MKPTSLRSLFSSILIGHFGALAALSGCSNTPPIEPVPSEEEPPAPELPPPPPLNTEGFDQFACDPALPGAAVALGLDSIERWAFEVPDPRYDNEKEPFEFKAKQLESDGTACANATDLPVCLIDLERARTRASQTGLLYSDWQSNAERLVVTKGGEVTTVDDKDKLVALLGPVDTLEKLRVFAIYSANGIPCQYVRSIETGFELIGRVSSGCSRLDKRVQVTIAGEEVWLEGKGPTSHCLGGRRPAGLAGQTVTSGGALGRYLERQAYLEAASIEAFERLALELEALGAPPELAAEARRAREDEVRHHAIAVALGRGFDPDFTCRAPSAAPAEPRSLFDFALENAVEGCVRETWGALLARHQAARAADAAVRIASSIIADDETCHAELAWATHAWLLGRLGEGERRELELGMRRAVDQLIAEVASGEGLSPDEMALLGLPSAGEARALLGRLGESLWAEPLAA